MSAGRRGLQMHSCGELGVGPNQPLQPTAQAASTGGKLPRLEYPAHTNSPRPGWAQASFFLWTIAPAPHLYM
jgi:hypothetical protein